MLIVAVVFALVVRSHVRHQRMDASSGYQSPAISSSDREGRSVTELEEWFAENRARLGQFQIAGRAPAGGSSGAQSSSERES